MSKQNSKFEIQATKEAILAYYHEGHANYDPELYAKILHPEWKFFMHDENELRIVNREEFCSWYAPEKLKPEMKWETEFYSVDVTGEIANPTLS